MPRSNRLIPTEAKLRIDGMVRELRKADTEPTKYTDFDDWMDAAESRGFTIRGILLGERWIARNSCGVQVGQFEGGEGTLRAPQC